MKKLMIAAAIVCAAAMSQAAAISWGSTGDTVLVDKNGSVATTDMGYDYVLVCLGTTVDYSNPLVRGVAGEFIYDEINVIQGSYDLVGGTDANNYWYAIMAKDRVSGDLAQLVYATGEKAGDVIEAYQLSWNGADYDTPEGFLVGTSGNFTVASVPEPTSGLLLLLGVAGLALRRRRA